MERFQSLRRAQKIDKNRFDTDIINAGPSLGSKYSKLSNKYEIERSQQISLDNKRWIVFNINDKNFSDIPLIRRRVPQFTKENTQATQKKSYKNHQKNHKFQLSFASIDNNIQVNDSFLQGKSKCLNTNASPFKNMSSLRSMKKEVALTECSSFESPKKQTNKSSIYKYFDKQSKNNKSNGSLLGLRQEGKNKSQIKSKRKVDISHRCLNKRKDQSKTILLGDTNPTEQNQKQQPIQIVNKSNNQKQIQFLMLFDPIELLHRHAQPRNQDFDSQQKVFWGELTKKHQKENSKEQIKQKYLLDQFESNIIEKNQSNEGWKELIDDFIHQITNHIVEKIANTSEKINDPEKITEQQGEIKDKQLFIAQNPPTLDQNILKQKEEIPINILHPSEQKKIIKNQQITKSIFIELSAIENIRIIKLQCDIGSSLIPEKIEESFVTSIPSSSLLHKKYRNDELVSLLNAIILINPKIIKNIFVPSKNGYLCKLFYHETFKLVEVDCEFAYDLNYFPIFGEAGQFLWFSVLIKALAIILGSFQAVASLKANQAFTIITGQQLKRLDLRNQEINNLQIIRQFQNEKTQNKMVMARKDGIFYFISKLKAKKHKIKQQQKTRGLLNGNSHKGEQKCYKSLSQFLKKQSRNYMKKQLYNDTKMELKERSRIHKINFSTLIEEGFEVLVSQGIFPPKKINSIRSNIRNSKQM